VSYEFDGASRHIFATLVVRLTHHQHFTESMFWRDAARYSTEDGGQFIVVLDEVAPSRGRLSVYFEDAPQRDEQITFLRYVHGHLIHKAVPESVVAHRENHCPDCGHRWDETVVENRLRLGKSDIICPNCETRSPLVELLLNDSDPGVEQAKQDVRLIDADAQVARSRQMAVTAIRGKEQFGEYDIFLSYNSHDRDAVLLVAEMLKGVGIRPWLDVWDLIPGKPWQSQLEEAIDKVNSAAVCVGGLEMGPWQDHEVAAFIRKFVKRESPVMPVILPGAGPTPELPAFLESFMWVDLRELRADNPRPLANLVAGILGRRPNEMRHDSLADQVSAILAPQGSAGVPESVEGTLTAPKTLPSIVLPVNRPELSPDELSAVVQQTAQLLGISSRDVRLVRTEEGSVRVVLQLDDMIAVSQLFSMAQKGDPDLIKFFDRCQISIDQFQEANSAVPPQLAERLKEENARQPDELDQKIGKITPNSQLREWSGDAAIATLAIVFTDIVDSTKLCFDLGDTTWDGYRQLHFAQVKQLIAKCYVCFIKNTGDGVLAAFHNADDEVMFAQCLARNTGHAVVRVRVGVHIGQVSIDADDAFGIHVNLAARVMSHLKSDGGMISNQVKTDLDTRRSPLLANLEWE
jgi:class 3 adenylate cyclase